MSPSHWAESTPAPPHPYRDWRRLTALWKAYLADDDWARILESLALNDSGPDIPTLIRIHNVNPNVEEDLADFVVEDHEDHHLALMLDEGRLVGDPHLQGAAAVLALLRSSIGDEGGEAGIDVLVATASFDSIQTSFRRPADDAGNAAALGPRLRRALADAIELTEQTGWLSPSRLTSPAGSHLQPACDASSLGSINCSGYAEC